MVQLTVRVRPDYNQSDINRRKAARQYTAPQIKYTGGECIPPQ